MKKRSPVLPGPFMSDKKESPVGQLGDLLALKAQELRSQGLISGEQALLKIDYREHAAKAPFQFDIAKGKLHQTHCNSIPSDSKSALYALWNIEKGDQKFACKKCKPVEDQGSSMDKNTGTDILYGVLSVLDQFGSVLQDRGREYRESDQGKQAKSGIDGLLSTLNEGQKDSLNLILASLEGALEIVNDYNKSMEAQKNDHDDEDMQNKD